jgi:hypothetical protein
MQGVNERGLCPRVAVNKSATRGQLLGSGTSLDYFTSFTTSGFQAPSPGGRRAGGSDG